MRVLAVVAALACVAAAAAHGLRLPAAPGCPVFPASNPWNQRVDRLPVARGSAAIVAAVGADEHVHADFGSGLWQGSPIGIPITVVPGSQAKTRVSFDYADESDRGPYPIPANVRIEGGADRHALIVDRDRCRLYELYALERRGGRWHAGSGAIWNLRSNELRPAGWTSADAAGLPILPGLARYDEVARGAYRPRAALHRRAHAARVRLPGAALRERRDRSLAAADGAPLPAQGVAIRSPASRARRGSCSRRSSATG